MVYIVALTFKVIVVSPLVGTTVLQCCLHQRWGTNIDRMNHVVCNLYPQAHNQPCKVGKYMLYSRAQLKTKPIQSVRWASTKCSCMRHVHTAILLLGDWVLANKAHSCCG